MVLSLICNTNLKAQDTDLNFSVEITDATSYTDSDGSIIIIVDGSDSRYTFMLYDKEPWQGGEKIAKENKSGSNYTFTGLKPGNYTVCVQNRDKVSRCKNVSIETK
jgi:hypothetical protein